MKISIFKRLITVYRILIIIFKRRLSPLVLFLFILPLRLIISFFRIFDKIFFLSLSKIKISKPIIIAGNPRYSTTFLQRFLVTNKFGEEGIIY